MIDRWDVIRVVCVKQLDTLKVGYRYDIKGRGNLSFNHDPRVGGKKGHGYCIEDPNIKVYSGSAWMQSSDDSPIYYYFTENEMNDYFITEDEELQIELRDKKINQVLDK